MALPVLCPRCSALGENVTRDDAPTARYCQRCNLVWRDEHEPAETVPEYPRSSSDRTERAIGEDDR